MTEAAVRTRLWRNGVLEKENFPLEDVSGYICQDDCLVWADLQAPDAERLVELGRELDLNALAVEDVTAHHERPKASRYASHTFLTAYSLQLDASGELAYTQVSAFVLKHAFVTVHADEFDVTASSSAGTRTAT